MTPTDASGGSAFPRRTPPEVPASAGSLVLLASWAVMPGADIVAFHAVANAL